MEKIFRKWCGATLNAYTLLNTFEKENIRCEWRGTNYTFMGTQLYIYTGTVKNCATQANSVSLRLRGCCCTWSLFFSRNNYCSRSVD